MKEDHVRLSAKPRGFFIDLPQTQTSTGSDIRFWKAVERIYRLMPKYNMKNWTGRDVPQDLLEKHKVARSSSSRDSVFGLKEHVLALRKDLLLLPLQSNLSRRNCP